jgi:hypothetical protein
MVQQPELEQQPFVASVLVAARQVISWCLSNVVLIVIYSPVSSFTSKFELIQI